MSTENNNIRKEEVNVGFDFQPSFHIVATSEVEYKRKLAELKRANGLKSFTEARMIFGIITPYNPTFDTIQQNSKLNK